MTFEDWWDRKRAPLYPDVDARRINLAEEVWDAGRTALRESIAAGIEAARREQECACDELKNSRAVYRSAGHYQSVVSEHDSRCPKALVRALAARIRSGEIG